MAEHYGTAVVHVRVRSPRDKDTVKGAVGNLLAEEFRVYENYCFKEANYSALGYSKLLYSGYKRLLDKHLCMANDAGAYNS